MSEHRGVIVAGAGLAGLSAARELAIHGVDVLVLEAGDGVGGRVRTDVVDGLRLDRGFQLLNPSYPEAARVLDLDALDLRTLAPGVVVALEGRRRARLGDPRRRPAWATDALSTATGSLASKSRFARYAWHAVRTSVPDLLAGPDFSAEVALRSTGIDDALLDRVLRPFLSGVFLEPDLATSRRFLDLVLRSFMRATPAVPATGMQAIPDQLHAALPPGSVRLNVPVAAVTGSTVSAAGMDFTADAVIVATDPRTATSLTGVPAPTGNAVTTWYHLAPVPTGAITNGDAILVVDGLRRGPVMNTVAMTNAAPEYASGGRTLIASSVLGAADTVDDERRIRTHLALLYGEDTGDWEPVRAYRIPYALPAMLPPLDVRKPVALGDGLFIAGDHRDTASIQGAMVSGRRAADAALRHLGFTPIS